MAEREHSINPKIIDTLKTAQETEDESKLSTRFRFEGVLYEVNEDDTYNVNLVNEGSPFIVGREVNDRRRNVQVKAFLVEWV